VEIALEHLTDRDEVASGSSLGNVKELLFRPVERVFDVCGIVEADVCDLGSGMDQASQRRRALDDSPVIFDVYSSGDGVDQFGQVADATNLLEQCATLKLVNDRHKIGWLATVVEVKDGLVNMPIRGSVKII